MTTRTMSTILKWLLDNSTWIFSGIGVTLIVGFIGWLRRRKAGPLRSNSVKISKSSISSSMIAGRDNIIQTVNVSSSRDPTDDEYSETPTANEIRVQTDSLPILQQEAARRNYEGLKVKWPARISSIREFRTKPGVAEVTLRYGDENWGAIICIEVELDKQPRLRSVYGGEPVVVTGTIVEMQPSAILLALKKFAWRKT